MGASRRQQIADVMETTPAWFFEGAPGIGFVRLPPRLKRSIVSLIVTTAGETEAD